jgi:hypothetical protein
MPGLVPGIHVSLAVPPENKTWMAGTSPAMTGMKNAGPESPDRRGCLATDFS